MTTHCETYPAKKLLDLDRLRSLEITTHYVGSVFCLDCQILQTNYFLKKKMPQLEVGLILKNGDLVQEQVSR